MPKVEILTDNCKCCEYCMSVCPKHVLEVGTQINKQGYRYVVPAHPENCIGCALCATMCPDCAIEIYK